MEQARQAFKQAEAAYRLVAAGSREEDVESAAGGVEEAEQALRLLLRGSRPEDVRAAEARLAQARAALAELLAGTRKEEVAQARAAALAAKETAKSARVDLAERVVRAPKDGVVERIPVAVGDVVAPGGYALRMSDLNDLWIRVFAPEAQLANVSVGESALLRIDGLDRPAAARVESVSTLGEFTPANLQAPEERGKQVFGVRLRLVRPDPRVKAGMYATVKRLGNWEP
jgi:multidrug resistance efflux pump